MKVTKIEPLLKIDIGKYKSNSNSKKDSKEFQKTFKKQLDQNKKK